MQEWWGIVPQLKRVCDRLASEGFLALAPDLYHGEAVHYTEGKGATHTEMDKAGQLMNAMPPGRAARDMDSAVDFLLGHDAVRGDKLGVIGFCMGGALALLVAARAGDRIGAAVPFYGAPAGDMEPDWSGLTAPVEGHFAENDGFFAADQCRALESKLKGMGKDVTFIFHPGTGHGFANDADPLGNYNPDAAEQAWSRALKFLHAKLG
jgi:carboxymethylenebutenolidase